MAHDNGEERMHDIDQLQALLSVVKSSRDSYVDDVSTLNSSLSHFDNTSPIIVSATDKISRELSEMPFAEQFGNIIGTIQTTINNI